MESLGMQLYEMYCAHDDQINNCENESWDDMDAGTQQVWEALAQTLSEQGWSAP